MMTRVRWLGMGVAAVALLVDQVSKQWLLRSFDIADRQPVQLAPVLDLVLAWNKGISYSLFTTDSRYGPGILLAITLTATVLLAVWLWRSTSTVTAVALGLLIGGALGNAYDRFAYGAVVDFVHFHVGRFSWYIFNAADVAIVCGVALLLIESLLMPRVDHASKLPKKTI